jgi:hypothetical protein
LYSVVRIETNLLRAVRRSRTRWLSMLLTSTSRSSAAYDLRQSKGVVRISLVQLHHKSSLGVPGVNTNHRELTSRSACECHTQSEPVSSAIRTADGACFRMASSISSGVDAHLPCQIRLPSPSITQTAVSLRETSNPT